MMGYILSVKMYSSENCGTIRVKYNMFWGYQFWEEYMAYPIPKNWAWFKGYVYGLDFGRLVSLISTVFNWFWVLPLGSSFFLSKPAVVTLNHLSLTLRIVESLCENIPLNIRNIDNTKKIRVQNLYWGFFNFCRSNVYGF